MQDHELQQVKQALDAANEQLEAFHIHRAQPQSAQADPYSTWILHDWFDEGNGITRLHDPETQLLFSQAGSFSDWPAVVGRLDGGGHVVSANVVVQALHVLNSALKGGQLGRCPAVQTVACKRRTKRTDSVTCSCMCRILHGRPDNADALVDYDAGAALLSHAMRSSLSGPLTTADSQAASIEIMECFSFSEHQHMRLSEFEGHLRTGLQLFEAYTQGRLRVHDRELHVWLPASLVCSRT